MQSSVAQPAQPRGCRIVTLCLSRVRIPFPPTTITRLPSLLSIASAKPRTREPMGLRARAGGDPPIGRREQGPAHVRRHRSELWSYTHNCQAEQGRACPSRPVPGRRWRIGLSKRGTRNWMSCKRPSGLARLSNRACQHVASAQLHSLRPAHRQQLQHLTTAHLLVTSGSEVFAGAIVCRTYTVNVSSPEPAILDPPAPS